MKFSTSIIIFFLAMIALVAEIILYFIFGMGAIFSGGVSSLLGTAFVFITLMVLTAAAGILAPICSILEIIINKLLDISKIKEKTENKFINLFLKDIGQSLLATFLILILITMVIFGTVGMNSISEKIQDKPIETTTNTTTQNNTTNETTINTPIQNNTTPTIDPIKEYITKSLTLEEITVGEGYGKYDIPGYSSIKPTVTGKIRNNGNRTLSLVEITVYFLNSENKRISEEKYYPVNTNSYMYPTDPLKPNYINDFGYIVNETAPSEWANKVEVEITNISFE